jgi:hypothetical protein
MKAARQSARHSRSSRRLLTTTDRRERRPLGRGSIRLVRVVGRGHPNVMTGYKGAVFEPVVAARADLLH